MIKFNGQTFSGSIIKNDESELIISIYAVAEMNDILTALNGVKTVTEIVGETESIYGVNTATSVHVAVKGVYNITFSKRMTIIEEMNNAIDQLLLMALEG